MAQEMTKTDKNGQETDLRSLSVRQQNAVDLLVVGQTDGQVAEAVGVTRQTVCGWRLYHPAFQAELNRQRKAVWGSSADRLRSLLPRALDCLEEALDGPDGSKVALQVVKMTGLGGEGVKPMGQTDADRIIESVARQMDSDFLISALGGADPELAERKLAGLLEDSQSGE